ncbi:MAG: metallophosphoesterase [Lachnospiraceae bacterium]|nr:metallophosphoesterase [Lachnospiraceae bacterium]
MLRILVFSDTHRYLGNLERALKSAGHIDFAIELGDYCGQDEEIRCLVGVPCAFVRGNCDGFDRTYESDNLADYDGIKIFMTHGHRYWGANPKLIAEAAKGKGADIAFFGHTHVPFEDKINGVDIFNPGSISNPRQADGYPTYGILTIEDNLGSNGKKKYRFEIFRVE